MYANYLRLKYVTTCEDKNYYFCLISCNHISICSFPLFVRLWVPDTSPWPSAKFSALKITTSLHSLSLSVLMFLVFDVAFIAPDGYITVYKQWHNCVMLINLCHKTDSLCLFQFNAGLHFHFAWERIPWVKNFISFWKCKFVLVLARPFLK
jgi:hypothetical protein